MVAGTSPRRYVRGLLVTHLPPKPEPLPKPTADEGKGKAKAKEKGAGTGAGTARGVGGGVAPLGSVLQPAIESGVTSCSGKSPLSLTSS